MHKLKYFSDEWKWYSEDPKWNWGWPFCPYFHSTSSEWSILIKQYLYFIFASIVWCKYITFWHKVGLKVCQSQRHLVLLVDILTICTQRILGNYDELWMNLVVFHQFVGQIWSQITYTSWFYSYFDESTSHFYIKWG